MALRFTNNLGSPARIPPVLRGRDCARMGGVGQAQLHLNLEHFCYNIGMDDEVFEKAKEEDMSKDEAEELQELMDETGLDVDEAHELWQEL